MKDNIFAELYNKLLGFFRQAEEEESAKDVACNRLRVVLMQDRTNLTPQLLERMRSELVELLSKYLEMDKEALELNLEQEGEQMALMLSIPVIRAKDEEEIEKALAEAEKASEEAEEDADDSADDAEDEVPADEDSEENSDEASEDEVEPKSEAVSVSNSAKAAAMKFPNKEICGDCRECELSDDIECEKKQQAASKKTTK